MSEAVRGAIFSLLGIIGFFVRGTRGTAVLDFLRWLVTEGWGQIWVMFAGTSAGQRWQAAPSFSPGAGPDEGAYMDDVGRQLADVFDTGGSGAPGGPAARTP